MSSYQTLRAEIKAWERSFKARTGSQPNIQDIKDNAQIAEKYKLYKKLSKNPAYPEPGSLLLKQPNPAPEKTAPLASYNPFSPQKDRTKRPDTNPFASPIRKSRLSASPPTLPPPQLSSTGTNPLLATPSHSDPLVSRARKRLRGDFVSPSPEKRRKVGSFQAPDLAKPGGSDVEDEEDEEEEDEDFRDTIAASSSFMDDSPVKASSARKSFRLLFEDVNVPPPDLSGSRPSQTSEFDMLVDTGPVPPRPKPKKAPQKSRVAPGRLVPTIKDDLFRPLLSDRITSTKSAKEKTRRSASLHADGSDDLTTGTNEGSSSVTSTTLADSEHPDKNTRLLPPSPPPPDTSDPRSYASKAKGRTAARKPAKELQDSDDEDSSSDLSVKVVRRPRHMTRKETSEGSDSEPIVSRDGRISWDTGKSKPGELDVDIPDELLDVLNLAPTSYRPYDTLDEEDAVHHLVYGRPRNHYDSDKGGEIWNAGEYGDDRQTDDLGVQQERVEGDDEWEGEPVPWERAEL